MTMAMQVEICIDSLESARAAQSGGADRVELCADLPRGGTTPSAGLIESVRRSCSLDLRILVRPRPGDFVYSSDEIEIMHRDVVYAKHVGANGIVIGALRADGSIDQDAMRSLMTTADPLNVTFHRAFDVVSDSYESIEMLAELGVDMVLTSGRRPSAPEGQELIRDLVVRSGGRIRIMAGAGLSPQNVRALVEFTDVQDVHVGSGVSRKRKNLSVSMFTEDLLTVDADLVRVFREAASS
jgi:copper homeostasis protein